MATVATKQKSSILLWPMKALWWLVTRVEHRIGIAGVLVAGTVLMLLGYWLISTIIGAVLGIPMFLIGLLLFIRGIW